MRNFVKSILICLVGILPMSVMANEKVKDFVTECGWEDSDKDLLDNNLSDHNIKVITTNNCTVAHYFAKNKGGIDPIPASFVKYLALEDSSGKTPFEYMLSYDMKNHQSDISGNYESYVLLVRDQLGAYTRPKGSVLALQAGSHRPFERYTNLNQNAIDHLNKLSYYYSGTYTTPFDDAIANKWYNSFNILVKELGIDTREKLAAAIVNTRSTQNGRAGFGTFWNNIPTLLRQQSDEDAKASLKVIDDAFGDLIAGESSTTYGFIACKSPYISAVLTSRPFVIEWYDSFTHDSCPFMSNVEGLLESAIWALVSYRPVNDYKRAIDNLIDRGANVKKLLNEGNLLNSAIGNKNWKLVDELMRRGSAKVAPPGYKDFASYLCYQVGDKGARSLVEDLGYDCLR